MDTKNPKQNINDAPFVAFYNMCVVTFVLPDEMAYMLFAEWLEVAYLYTWNKQHGVSQAKSVIPIPPEKYKI